MKKVSIVIPTYNEQGNIDLLATSLLEQFKELKYMYEVIFVDDGSRDKSLAIIKELHQLNYIFNYVKLSKNCGHQNALKAGIDVASGDCVISMDADMQHPPSLIPLMLEKWEMGYDVVYTIRKQTEGVSGAKKITSKLFYKIINALSEVQLEAGSADFRLLDKKICTIVRNNKEVELFFRAQIKATGFKQIAIEYIANKRNDGKSKYSLSAMLKLALTGITSFSVKPLHFAAYLGLFFALTSLLYVPYIVYSFFKGHVVSGWASLLVTIVFFGGLQLFVLGIIGIYIGKIFKQVKQQPNYFIEETSLSNANHTA
jgi:dolichol-phosphate mannosyltransferase